jgi:hypothetical protein
MTRQHRVVQAVAVAATIAGLGAPAAVAQDLRSPDVQDAASSVQQSATDLRSPDVRDAAGSSQQPATPAGDLRSPDVRDAAGAARQLETPAADLRSPDVRDAATKVVSSVVTPAAEPSVSDAFQWGDAAIGAGAAVAAIALAGGLLVAGRRRLHHSGAHIAH